MMDDDIGGCDLFWILGFLSSETMITDGSHPSYMDPHPG